MSKPLAPDDEERTRLSVQAGGTKYAWGTVAGLLGTIDALRAKLAAAELEVDKLKRYLSSAGGMGKELFDRANAAEAKLAAAEEQVEWSHNVLDIGDAHCEAAFNVEHAKLVAVEAELDALRAKLAAAEAESEQRRLDEAYWKGFAERTATMVREDDATIDALRARLAAADKVIAAARMVLLELPENDDDYYVRQLSSQPELTHALAAYDALSPKEKPDGTSE